MHFQLNFPGYARFSTEAYRSAKGMAPLRSMTGFAGNFQNMTGEDDEKPAKLLRVIAKVLDNTYRDR